MYKLIVIGIVFLLGLYFIYKSNDIEAFHGIDGDNKNSSTSITIIFSRLYQSQNHLHF